MTVLPRTSVSIVTWLTRRLYPSALQATSIVASVYVPVVANRSSLLLWWGYSLYEGTLLLEVLVRDPYVRRNGVPSVRQRGLPFPEVLTIRAVR